MGEALTISLGERRLTGTARLSSRDSEGIAGKQEKGDSEALGQRRVELEHGPSLD